MRGCPVLLEVKIPDVSSELRKQPPMQQIQRLVYVNHVNSDEALVARIAVEAGDIRGVPGLFANFGQSLRRRCETCIFVGGHFFEQCL
ncbi:hypothetical protein TNCV_2609091 [Trichonephila clavipes]|nr:hypothetical protein TNCV_2609091 [Trichonephila clavipes]